MKNLKKRSVKKIPFAPLTHNRKTISLGGMNENAQKLAMLARGKPKRFSAEELRRRSERLAAVRYRGGRKPGSKNKVRKNNEEK